MKFQQWVLENTIEQRLLGYSKVMNKWIQGARPRTLPAAIAPVLTASALSYRQSNKVDWLNALLALLVGLLLQIGVNFSNDYSDGVKGSDANRVGPVRLVGSGLASAASVKRAAILTYLLGAISGLVLALRTNPILILIGLISIAAAWYYTGGKSPYGYRGLGEVSVFIFFGLVATNGTYFGETKHLSIWSFLLSVEMGLLACAILAVNNLRDLPKDEKVGKRTLAVRLGDTRARRFYMFLIFIAIFTSFTVTILAALGIFPAIKLLKEIQFRKGKELIAVLGATGKFQLILGGLLTIGTLVNV